MSTEYFWTLPTRGDGRGTGGAGPNRGDWASGPQSLVPSIRDVRPGRYSSFDHLAQITRAAAVAGFDGIFVPFDPAGEESWIVAAALAREQPRLTFVTEFSPTFGTPVYAAKMSATFQRFSSGRLGWKLAIDVDPATARAFGDQVAGPDRYVRAGEFLEVAAGLWDHGAFTYRGRFFEVEEGGLRPPLTRYPRPPVYLSGTDDDALELSAAHGDVHLWASVSPDELAVLRADLDVRAASLGRVVRHGVQLALVARETEDEAWDEARRGWRSSAAGSADVGSGDGFDALVTGPSTWSGFRLVGHEAAHGVVGSYRQVAVHLRALAEVGIETVIVGGRPGVEEAYRFGEHVAPLLDARQQDRRAV